MSDCCGRSGEKYVMGAYKPVGHSRPVLSSATSYDEVATIVGIEFDVEDGIGELGSCVGHRGGAGAQRHGRFTMKCSWATLTYYGCLVIKKGTINQQGRSKEHYACIITRFGPDRVGRLTMQVRCLMTFRGHSIYILADFLPTIDSGHIVRIDTSCPLQRIAIFKQHSLSRA